MGTIEELRKISQTVVRRLRKQKLEKGQPFLIWSPELPKDQSYLEFPDHSIKIVSISHDMKSFTVISELNTIQAGKIRETLGLN